MTVLVGGLRALNINADGSTHGVFTDRPGTLTNDFFVNLLDMGTEWKATSPTRRTSSRAATARPAQPSGPAPASTWSSARNSQLRALAEVYASSDAKEKFVERLRRGLDQGDERRPLRPRPEVAAMTRFRKGAGRARAFFVRGINADV